MEVKARKRQTQTPARLSPLRIRRLLEAADSAAARDEDQGALSEIAARYDVTNISPQEMDSLCQELYSGGWIGFGDQALLSLPGRTGDTTLSRNYLQAWQRVIDAQPADSSPRQSEPLRRARRILTILSNLAELSADGRD
jgi:hypothetical protein